MATTPMKSKTINRAKLAQFLPNPELIRDFENLISDVNEGIPGNVDDVRSIAEAAQALSELLKNRSYVTVNAESDLDSARMLTGSGGIQIADSVTPGTVLVRTINLLAALDGLSAAGLLVRTGATTAAARTLSATTTRIAITNGNGVAGNPSFDVNESALDLAAMGGTLTIAKGGTGAATAAAARTALGIDSFASATGDFKQRAAASFPTGWVRSDAGTIGNAGSGATRANADTQALFTLWWAFTDAQLPIQTSTGAASTRGASATADFTANKRMAVPVVADAGLLIGGYKL